ncbi:hypothetical protein DSO57_1008095 [Entomophthora muscae]|uniref:Uncharacterized protein n=1 Tax=Entomophthora muscae TaxID=34485 RepID=A0ACC2RY97_9FUNG|nr:hypothetical protein DSO57_1008095 [Entomophthora muscae]
MIIPTPKFVVFLGTGIVIYLDHLPNLWDHLSFLAHFVGGNPSRILHFLDDLPGKASNFLLSGEILVKSLTCDDLELYSSIPNPDASLFEESLLTPSPLLEENIPDNLPVLYKKSSQKPAKPLNPLEDLAHTVDEIFVLAYPSQVVHTDALNYVPTWEKYLINLDYLLAWGVRI